MPMMDRRKEKLKMLDINNMESTRQGLSLVKVKSNDGNAGGCVLPPLAVTPSVSPSVLEKVRSENRKCFPIRKDPGEIGLDFWKGYLEGLDWDFEEKSKKSVLCTALVRAASLEIPIVLAVRELYAWCKERCAKPVSWKQINFLGWQEYAWQKAQVNKTEEVVNHE